jgi:hypothetical protein
MNIANFRDKLLLYYSLYVYIPRVRNYERKYNWNNWCFHASSSFSDDIINNKIICNNNDENNHRIRKKVFINNSYRH